MPASVARSFAPNARVGPDDPERNPVGSLLTRNAELTALERVENRQFPTILGVDTDGLEPMDNGARPERLWVPEILSCLVTRVGARNSVVNL